MKKLFFVLYVVTTVAIGYMGVWYIDRQIEAEFQAQKLEAQYEDYHNRLNRGENPLPPEPLGGDNEGN